MDEIENAIGYMLSYGSECHIETAKKALARYKEMQKQIDWLYCLEEAGVSNWSGIDYAIQLRNERK